MVRVKRCETASHGSGAGRALGPISYRRRVTPQRRSRAEPPDTTSSSSSVTGAAGAKGHGKGRSRSAAAVERRVLKGIAKRWEQQLQKEDSVEQEVPSFGPTPDQTRATEYYQAQSEAASAATGGHGNYANFLAPHARLKRPLEQPRSQGEGSVYSRVWSRFERELPLVAAEVAKTPGKSARRSYLCSEAKKAVIATLGSTAAERQEKEEAGSDGGVEGFEPNVSARRYQLGAVTACAENVSEQHSPTTRYTSSSSSCTIKGSSATTWTSSKPPTIGCDSDVATPAWYQHDTSRRRTD